MAPWQRGPNRVAPGHTRAVPHSLIRRPAPGETVFWVGVLTLVVKGGKRSVGLGGVCWLSIFLTFFVRFVQLIC